MGNVTQKNEKSITVEIKINEKEIGDHLSRLVRQSVRIPSTVCLMPKQILFVMQPAISPDRLYRRADSYKRKLLTTTSEVELPVSRLRRLLFETQIIQRYQFLDHLASYILQKGFIILQ